jgi:hypothetical protein
MYILRLSSSWGTSRIYPAWSPSEHQLTPSLSPFWDPRPKPRRPEEVVCSLNDSCSHFTPRLFPPKLPCNIHELFLAIHSTSFISIVHHIHAGNYIFYLDNIFTLSFFQVFMVGQLPSVLRVHYKYSTYIYAKKTIICTYKKLFVAFSSVTLPLWWAKFRQNDLPIMIRLSDIGGWSCLSDDRAFCF